MLIQLKIKNLILIESANISFENGLNILTGETGSGKSAVLSAILLITGSRAETELIGKHGDVAIVEAELSQYTIPEGITPPRSNENLLIRREIHRSGKNRCFAADQLISLSLLRQIVGSSIEFVDQSSTHQLCSKDTQRNILDTFAENEKLNNEVAHLFFEKQVLEKRIDTLLQTSRTKERELDFAKEDLAFIEKVSWKKGEEEEIFQNYNRLTSSHEMGESLALIAEHLKSTSLKKAASTLQRCVSTDPSLSPLYETLKNAIIQIEEVEQGVHVHLSNQETDLNELAMLDERLTNIEQLKRRFGKTWDLVQEKKTALSETIFSLENLDQELKATKTELNEKKETVLSIAKALSDKRKCSAQILEKAVVETLRRLNLPNARFTIDIQDTPLNSHGIDNISFLFSANVGQDLKPIEECASGGELSRALFAIKVVTQSKDSHHCFVFDEIDANVGGHTATILGEELKKIAKTKQVICVTHFVQVARFAQKHFVVTKHEKKERTETTITTLGKREQALEYDRMLGTT